MIFPNDIEHLAQERRKAIERELAKEVLLRQMKQPSKFRPSIGRKAVHELGIGLEQVGLWLQARSLRGSPAACEYGNGFARKAGR